MSNPDDKCDTIPALTKLPDIRGEWPKITRVYLHGSKEAMWDTGEKLGLTGEPLSAFRYCCHEVEVNIAVNEDGSYRVLGAKY